MDFKKYTAFVVEHWMPPMITGIVGLGAGLSLSLFESEASNNRFFLEKQVVTADHVASEFSRYVENWRRLIELRRYVESNKEKPTEDDKKHLLSIVSARNNARDKLFAALDSLNLYYGEDVSKITTEFRSWDEQQALKTINELPHISEWQHREKKIFKALRKELMQ